MEMRLGKEADSSYHWAQGTGQAEYDSVQKRISAGHWWLTMVILVLRRLRQKAREFKSSLPYKGRP